MKAALAVALAGGVAIASPAAARELWGQGDASLELSGSLREIGVVTHGTDAGDFTATVAANLAACLASFADCPAFDEVGDTPVFTSLTRLRTRLDLRLDEHWSAAVAYDHELRAGTLDTFEGSLGESLSTPSLFEAEQDILDGDRVAWRHRLYRGYLTFRSEHFEAVAGRQRIAWGVGRLWNPIDRFNAIPPLAIEGDESVGVDSLALRWLPTGFTFVEAVLAPQRDFEDSSYALRLHGILRDLDYSLMAGVFEEAWTLGFDLAGNLGDAAARVEFVFSDPERGVRPVGASAARELDPFFQVVGSIDYVVSVGSGLYVLLEHLYNGNDLGFGQGKAGPLLPLFEQSDAGVVPTDADRFGGSRVVTNAPNLTGFQVGYDLTPDVRGDLLVIYDWKGESASFFPALRYNPFHWLELTAGAQLFVGPHRSQFGDSEALGFLIAEAFF